VYILIRVAQLKTNRSVLNYIKDEKLPRQTQSLDTLPTYYNRLIVHELWSQCIKYGVVFLDPLLAKTVTDYNATCDRLQKLIEGEVEAELAQTKRFLSFNRVIF